ncbi:MAG: NADP-dependent oxidoreductase, partial [Alphaproteobacteria bacterium]
IPGLEAGDLVQARLGWQTHPTLAAEGLQKLDLSLGDAEAWIGPLGTSALTAYFGMTAVGVVRPGETVLVSGAAGAVGQIAAQVGTLSHCRVVGIAGGAETCAYLKNELGLAAIDYKATDDLASAIRAAAPEGVDLYFDNVGGPTLDAAIAGMAPKGRIAICGRISQTAAAELYGVKNLGL